jgi:phosphate transport system substrate-binding protein
LKPVPDTVTRRINPGTAQAFQHAFRHFLAGLLLASVMAGSPSAGQADQLRIGGTGGALGTMQRLADAYARQQPATTVVIVPNLGSSGGIKAVTSGAIELAVSGREPNDTEIAHGAKAIAYGRTPFVFAVANDSRIRDITIRELAALYSGRTERWPDGSRARVVLRPDTDTDTTQLRTLFPELVEADREARKRAGLVIAITDHDAAQTLETLPGAIGTTTLAMILSEKRSLRALRLNGVEPSVKALANGSYPYFKSLSLVTGPTSPSTAQQFIAFVRSPAGREILSRYGHWVP